MSKNRPANQMLFKIPLLLIIILYCLWKKSCTSWYGKNPIIYRVLYIPGQVVQDFFHQQYYGGFLKMVVPNNHGFSY